MAEIVTQEGPLLDFRDRTVVITGTSSGIGAEALRGFLAAGADVHAVDVAAPDQIGIGASGSVGTHQGGGVQFHRADIGDKAAIDDLVAALPKLVDALVNCAGVPNGGKFDGEQVMRINWLGLRHLTESLLPRMEDGGSVVHIASTAGRAWSERVAEHQELMAASTFDEGLAWMKSNPDAYGDGYVFSKQTVQYYTLWRSVQLLAKGIRMNSICPGITDTNIIGDFRRGVGADIIDHAAAVAGRFAHPSEMVPAMLFLADNRSSSYISGVNLNIDRGTAAARETDQSDPLLIWGQDAES